MSHDWVLDVLRDLEAYARANGLTALATKVDEARSIAAAEAGTQRSGAAPSGARPGTPQSH